MDEKCQESREILALVVLVLLVLLVALVVLVLWVVLGGEDTIDLGPFPDSTSNSQPESTQTKHLSSSSQVMAILVLGLQCQRGGPWWQSPWSPDIYFVGTQQFVDKPAGVGNCSKLNFRTRRPCLESTSFSLAGYRKNTFCGGDSNPGRQGY